MVSTLQSIKYRRGSFAVLDQTLLPFESTYLECHSLEDIWHVIYAMKVRGAPAIALSAALGLASLVWQKKNEFSKPQTLLEYISSSLDYLVLSRPTAVNLSKMAEDLKIFIGLEVAKADLHTGTSLESLITTFVERCEFLYASDIEDNINIGKNGSLALKQLLGNNFNNSLVGLTHCNTGSLATAEYGTALGILRHLWSQGRLTHVYCTETRPYNQGARLTAYELVFEKIPATLICDSMSSALMATKKLDFVVVGADRVCKNGDTANKIGTYQLAIAARYHKIPFLVAAPNTSIDFELESGDLIEVEQRPEIELLEFAGKPYAAPGIRAWNPGFDVTPAELITAIVTERDFFINANHGKFALTR